MDARIEHIIKEALKEDGYDNDVTTKAVLQNNFVLTCQLIAKASGVVSGVDFAGGVFLYINSNIKVDFLRNCGSYVNRVTVFAYVQGTF
jgi:nicotinate-nucleotide pyrophosphorylase